MCQLRCENERADGASENRTSNSIESAVNTVTPVYCRISQYQMLAPHSITLSRKVIPSFRSSQRVMHGLAGFQVGIPAEAAETSSTKGSVGRVLIRSSLYEAQFENQAG